MITNVELFLDQQPGAPAVRGALHRAEKPSGEAIVMVHGAGSNFDAPLLRALAEAFAESGWAALRCDLPYRQARRFGPPHPAGAAQDREGLRLALGALRRSVAARRLFLGGHSYGGRQASLLAASDPSAADALLLLSYPLHPPRRPAQLRTAHFPELRTRALFLHGARDPFGSLEEMQAALKLIPAQTSLLPAAGAGHELVRRGATATDLARRTVDAFLLFVQ